MFTAIYTHQTYDYHGRAYIVKDACISPLKQTDSHFMCQVNNIYLKYDVYDLL